MRIGLLISEFNDKKECDICLGADRAARDLGAELIIFPGKYIITDKTFDKEDPYLYQYQAVYDYSIDADFDGFIVDIDKIGHKAAILKKEAFLKQFGKKPLITVTETEGFECIVSDKDTSDIELGYLAVEQILSKITGNNVKARRSEIEDFTVEKYTETIKKISEVSDIIINNKCNDVFEIGAKKFIDAGIENYEIFILEEPVEYSLKKGWKAPKLCKKLFSIHDGKPDTNVNSKDMKISEVFDDTGISGTKVIRNFFYEREQLGFFIIDFTEDFRVGYYDDILTNCVVAGSRNGYLENRLKNAERELAECQEEIARDGSVLDHIGDKDYLTDLPNRRGFFAKAYDLLKEHFREGTYAVVAYIDMDSLKNINAIHGHDEGDHAVIRVAQILNEVFGDKSVCGRIRGDEFAVLQVTEEEDKAEMLRIEMARQNNKLLMDNTKYLNHLIYSICEFDYEESLSLREMLKETDDNLKNMRRMETLNK